MFCVWSFLGGRDILKLCFGKPLFCCYVFFLDAGLFWEGLWAHSSKHKFQKQIQDNKFVVEARDICIRSNFDSSTMFQTPGGVWVNSWECFKIFSPTNAVNGPTPPTPCGVFHASQTGRIPFDSPKRDASRLAVRACVSCNHFGARN